ncbi:hypothetical protein SARC_15566, partial [Sphaeroforma arctica JP610]
VESQSLETQALFALTCQRWNGEGEPKCNSTVVDSIEQTLLNNIRVQGRTAYIAYEGGQSAALTTTALALSYFATPKEDAQVVDNMDKLANFVAQLGDPESGTSASASQMLLSMQALGDYDMATDSSEPDLKVTIEQGSNTILNEQFDSESNQT